MRRTSLLFCAGLVLGGIALRFLPTDDAGTALLIGGPERETAPAPTEPPTSPRAIEFLELVTGSIDATERAALQRLAAEADAATLASVTAQVASLPRLPSRAVALEVLLVRYAELDARGALRALGGFDAGTATTLGITLLQTLGNDELGIARVLEAAPQIDADRLRVEAAVAKAATRPEAALEDALLLPERVSASALARIAAAWARSDVHGALAYVERVGDERLRSNLTIAVLGEWVSSDPQAMLAYVRNSGERGAMLRRAALMRLVRDDALAALSHAEALPPGAEREQLLGAIAHAYGRADPAAAIAWAQASPSPGVLGSVLSGVARTDPDGAVELILALPLLQEQQRLTLSLVSSGALGARRTAALADRLLAQGGRAPSLQMLTNVWAQRAPEDALEWLLANRTRATTGAIAQAGASLARTNPAAAVAYVERMPSELRADWIAAVAEGYAHNDARAAASWVAQYTGEPGYDAAVAAVAGRSAARDPSAAARLFASVDVTRAPEAPTSARAIAASWARQDAAAAAEWAQNLGDGEIAVGAVGAVARQWAARDAASARDWALRLLPDARRDAALVQIVGATAGTAHHDPALLEGFSSPAALQAGLGEAVRIVAARDADAARQLADRYLTDPGVRRAAERFIATDGSLAER